MKRLLLNYSILISIGILLAAVPCAMSEATGGGGSVNVAGENSTVISSPLREGRKMTTGLSLHNHNVSGSSRGTVGSVGGTTVAISATDFDTMPSLDQIAHSSWLALASGAASIIGLMLTLYGTQIKTIPFSLYRSYVWNRVLLLSFGIGIIVFAGMQFYTQTVPPGFKPLNYLFGFLHGNYTFYGDVSFSNGTNLWGIIFFIGAAISIWGIRYDPVQISKSVVFREHESLLEYRKEQLSSVLGKDDYEGLKSHERRLYDDLSEFHVELQTRLIDTVYGQGPLPMFSRRMRSHDWPNGRHGVDGLTPTAHA